MTDTTPEATFNLAGLTDSQLIAHADQIGELCERLWDYTPATALVLNEAQAALLAEGMRREAGEPSVPVTVALESLDSLPDVELTGLQRQCREVAGGLEALSKNGGWWIALADACVDEELRRMLSSSKTNRC